MPLHGVSTQCPWNQLNILIIILNVLKNTQNEYREENYYPIKTPIIFKQFRFV
jgi:hypothetical protein